CSVFSSRRRHTRFSRDWSSDVCSSDLFRGDFYAEITTGRDAGQGPSRRGGFFGGSGLEGFSGVGGGGFGRIGNSGGIGSTNTGRSEERRVGKDGQAQGGAEHENTQKRT